jgi:hypothetical protein
MVVHVHFASLVAWPVIGIATLLWIMARGVAASKMEKQGIAFWSGFFTGLLLSPFAGLVAILVARMGRPSQRLAETVSRG